MQIHILVNGINIVKQILDVKSFRYKSKVLWKNGDKKFWGLSELKWRTIIKLFVIIVKIALYSNHVNNATI